MNRKYVITISRKLEDCQGCGRARPNHFGIMADVYDTAEAAQNVADCYRHNIEGVQSVNVWSFDYYHGVSCVYKDGDKAVSSLYELVELSDVQDIARDIATRILYAQMDQEIASESIDFGAALPTCAPE